MWQPLQDLCPLAVDFLWIRAGLWHSIPFGTHATLPLMSAIQKTSSGWVGFHSRFSPPVSSLPLHVSLALYLYLYICICGLIAPPLCCFSHSRSVSAAERCLAPIGRPGLWGPDTALAVSAGAARRFVQCHLHQLGGPIGRVPADRPGRGGQAVGREEGQAKHELR